MAPPERWPSRSSPRGRYRRHPCRTVSSALEGLPGGRRPPDIELRRRSRFNGDSRALVGTGDIEGDDPGVLAELKTHPGDEPSEERASNSPK